MSKRSHNNISRWALWVSGVLAAVAISGLLMQITYVDNEIEGCKRRQPIFEQLVAVIYDAAANADRNGNPDQAESYRNRAVLVKENIIKDCDEAFHRPFPFIE